MRKRLSRPLLKYEIEEAQANSLSAHQAAKYLGVSFTTYKKYAKFYGIYENLLNQKGTGISKGYSYSSQSIKLKDIFDNKHLEYPLQRLRWRMIARGLIDNSCMLCGFDEERITDQKKPLILVFKDKENDYTPTNLALLCYNCCFLTKDAPTIVNRKNIYRSIKEKIKESDGRDPWVDPTKLNVTMASEPENDLSDEEIRKLKDEINRELGRI